jgi:hypothetical protein
MGKPDGKKDDYEDQDVAGRIVLRWVLERTGW